MANNYIGRSANIQPVEVRCGKWHACSPTSDAPRSSRPPSPRSPNAGFARTTSRHVAARAGVTHGLLHHYFPDHQSLLAAAFEKMALEEIDEVNEILASDLDPLVQLREITEPYGPGGGAEAYRFWLEAWGEAGHSATLRARRRSVCRSRGTSSCAV